MNPLRSSLLVHVTQIDQEHVELALIANRLADSTNRADMLLIAQELLDKTRAHFATEESLMQRHEYAGMDSHVAIHRDLLRQADRMLEQLTADTISPTELAQFLKAWLHNHISGTDQFLGYYLRLRGVT